jgi:phosphatidylinositol 4-kinase
MILQYAHRVLAQHPVDVTFFFVPQIVQALRYDELGGSFRVQRADHQSHRPTGYVGRFIFDTAKISQLFCHQIVWNMKANCYKGDAGEEVRFLSMLRIVTEPQHVYQEDPMKPILDEMIHWNCGFTIRFGKGHL